jgi:hypothetical protein
MSGSLPCDSGVKSGQARHLGLLMMSRMVIGVLLTMAPLTFLTSNLPWSLFAFVFLTKFLAFLVPEGVGATRRDVDHGGGERDPPLRLGQRSGVTPEFEGTGTHGEIDMAGA